jgi:hypothetical protein
MESEPVTHVGLTPHSESNINIWIYLTHTLKIHNIAACSDRKQTGFHSNESTRDNRGAVGSGVLCGRRGKHVSATAVELQQLKSCVFYVVRAKGL